MADLSLVAALRATLTEAPPALPVHPAVTARTAALLTSKVPEADELIALAGSEPVLAGSLLRAANSAYYAGLPKVRTLDAALSRIGVETAARIIETACRNGQRPPPGHPYGHYLSALWQHSLGCALGARWLADRCGYPELAAGAHLAGLLHDLGKWPLLAGLARLAADRGGDNGFGEPLVAELLASLHVELGLQLVTEWHLPDELADVVGRHHRLELDGEELMVVLVRLANLGCRKVGLGGQGDPGLVLPTSAEAQFLGIDEISLAELEIMLEDRFGLLPASDPVPGRGCRQ